MECPECGEDHPTIDSLPAHPVSLNTLQNLEENESIIYTGPTMITSDGRTPMIVIATSSKVNVASFFDECDAWLITQSGEFDDVDEERGRLFNEMASQCIEAGYHCAEQWMEDGEPGASVPQ